MSKRGLFVTFEGIDGSGKSTQIDHIAAQLAAQKIPFIKTREPGGTKFGQDVRALLTADENIPMAAIPEMLLVNAARYIHVHSVIEPALDSGKWVLCDRFLDSTYAYQIFEIDADLSLFNLLNQFCVGRNVPDRTYVLDLDPVIARRRIAARRANQTDGPEKYRDFERIRRGFVAIAHQNTERCRLLDGSLEQATISAEIWSDIRAKAESFSP